MTRMQANYAERVKQLLSDGYLTGERGSDVRLTPKGVAKLHQLIHDGFLVLSKPEENAILTYKGIAVLMACADRPIRPRVKHIPIQRKGD